MIHNYVLRINGRNVIHYINKKNASCSQLTFWQNVSVCRVPFGILLQVMPIARRFHLEIPPQLMLLLKTLVHVEGLGTDLYPELDIWKLAKPILSDWIKAQMNPQKNIKELGQKIPDLLLGAQDLPTLLIDSLNGLKNQSTWHAKQLNEIQTMRLQMEHQQKRSWIFGSLIAILLSIAIIAPWYISTILIVLASLIAIWRVAK